MLFAVFQSKLNTIITSVVEFNKISCITFLLQDRAFQQVVHSLWFRATFACHIYIGLFQKFDMYPKEDMEIPKISPAYFIGNSQKKKEFFGREGK